MHFNSLQTSLAFSFRDRGNKDDDRKSPLVQKGICCILTE